MAQADKPNQCKLYETCERRLKVAEKFENPQTFSPRSYRNDAFFYLLMEGIACNTQRHKSCMFYQESMDIAG